MKKIQIYDTTLRDGSQGENISFSLEDKLHIARKLDELGVDYIEGGWPGSNAKDVAFFERARGLKLKHAKLAAFGSTAHPRNSAAQDKNLQALIDSETPVVTIFGMDLGQLIGTTVITETVFNLRGLGWLSIQSIQTQDLPVIMGVTIVAATAVVVANLFVDVLYAFIDPRVTYN